MEIYSTLCLIMLFSNTLDASPVRKITNYKDENDVIHVSDHSEIKKQKLQEVATYLSNYGYIPEYTEDSAALKESLKDFQFSAGLDITGDLDSVTDVKMKSSRCGQKEPDMRVKRLNSQQNGRRVRRFIQHGTWWFKNSLTWRYYHYENNNNAWRESNPTGLTEDQVREVMIKAMSMWEEKTNIKFIEDRTTSNPDIWVKFLSHRHNDPLAFDGRGGTLAHAFFPLDNQGLAGDVHFDDSERFTIGQDPGEDGRDLMWVAVHEIGHSLGLGESPEPTAVMYPWYPGYKPDIQLSYDDTLGIQLLYGGKIKPTESFPDHVKCPTSKVTAFWDSKSSFVLITEDNKAFEVSKINESLVHGNIEIKDLVSIPHKIDAAYQTNFGFEYYSEYEIIFADKGYYLYRNFSMISGPHDIHDSSYELPLQLGLPTWVRKVDAAMKWWANKKIYLFTGEWYWRYDELKGRIDYDYPKRISNVWSGLPGGGIDSAFSSHELRETYFTKGDRLFKIEEYERPMEIQSGYPRKIHEELLKCEG